MCRKLIYLIPLVLLLSLAQASLGQGVDSSLVGWWKLDATSGTTAADSSGNGNDGTLMGDDTTIRPIVRRALAAAQARGIHPGARSRPTG